MPRKGTPYGQGSVYQRADGMWVAVALAPGQSPRRFYGSSPGVTVERRADYLARHRLGLPTEATKLTLGRHLAAWLGSKRPPAVAPSTWASYELHVRYLVPLSGIRLPKLTPNDVRRHIQEMLTTPDERGETLSPATVNYNRRVLSMALKQAVDDGLIPRNVTTSVKPLKVPRFEPRILTHDEVGHFLDAAQSDPNGALWTTMLGTGLRLGEAVALRWQDIDLATGVLSVTGSISQIRRSIRQPGQARLSRVEPKTAAGLRTIKLPAFVVESLRHHRAEIIDKPRNIAGHVFTTPRGTPLDGTNVYHQWRRFLGAHGLPRLRQHDLRHTAASLMLASGSGLDDVMRHLGHSSITVTVNTYGHMVEGRSAEVAAGIERAIGG